MNQKSVCLSAIVFYVLNIVQVNAGESSTGFSLSKEIMGRARGNEFVSGDLPGTIMMKVNLWGAVSRPGIHYVPSRTDLITLLSYAGGPLDTALLGEVVLKRRADSKEETREINVNSLLHKEGQNNLVLEPNDIIVIPAKRPLVSQDTLAVLTVVSSILAIAVTGFVLTSRTR